MRPEACYGLLETGFHADPAPTFARMRAEAPVHWDPQLRTWVVTRHADVIAVVRGADFSVDRGGTIARWAGDGAAAELAWCSDFTLRWMVFSDPPRHTRLRGAVQRAFSAVAVARLRPAVEDVVERTLAGLVEAGRFDVIHDLAAPVPARITALVLGVPDRDAGLLKQWTADMFALFGAGVATAPVIRAAHASLTACRDYFADLLAERRRRPADDLISALVGAPDAAHLDDDERIGLCATLTAGAYETTTHVVGNGVWALLRHPAQLARLRDQPDLIDNAVEEVFRWDGPALSVVRRAVGDTAVAGVPIAAGDKLYCMLYSANRDPARYPDPDRFDVARADPRHLGLGHGIHFCLGAALSRLEAAVMLAALVRLPGLAVDHDALAGRPPRYLPNLAIRGLAGLPVCCDRGHRRALAAPST